MVYHPIEGSTKDRIAGKTLVIPSISLANLPQLTVDLLIHSLKLQLVGYVGRGETVVPFAGYSSAGITTGGMEVYGRDGLDVVVVQQRSPVLKTKKDEHVDLIRRFILESKPRFTLLLTSLDAANQDDQSLLTPHLSLLPPSPASSTPASLSSLPPFPTPTSTGEPSKPSYPPFIPSGGLSRRLLTALETNQLPHGTIGAWCVEGDNRSDALSLASIVLRVLDIEGVQISQPKEWDGLFGTVDGWSGGAGMDAEMYG